MAGNGGGNARGATATSSPPSNAHPGTPSSHSARQNTLRRRLPEVSRRRSPRKISPGRHQPPPLPNRPQRSGRRTDAADHRQASLSASGMPHSAWSPPISKRSPPIFTALSPPKEGRELLRPLASKHPARSSVSATAGKTYFATKCASCHSETGMTCKATGQNIRTPRQRRTVGSLAVAADEVVAVAAEPLTPEP